MIDRIDYMKMCAESLNESECRRLFDCDREEMLEGTAVWNFSLEVAYNEFCDGDDYEDYEDDGNMPCDDTGYCDITCPQYWQCHRQLPAPSSLCI